MGLKIALISRDNGVGLSLDANLLKGMFESAGHEARFFDWQEQSMPRADVAFHLELVSRNLAQHSEKNIAILNLEWFPTEWMKYLPAFDQIWAKSGYALRFCRNRGGKNVQFTGFLGLDLYDPKVKRELKCMHLRGKSGMKGTEQVIGAWQKDDGIRIDHHLLSPQAADRLKGAGIDKFTRSWEKPSDHVPVWIALEQ